MLRLGRSREGTERANCARILADAGVPRKHIASILGYSSTGCVGGIVYLTRRRRKAK